MTAEIQTVHADLLPWLKAHRQDVDAVLLDVDGVLMTSRKPLPGSGELVAWLRAAQKPFVLITNDGCNSPAEKLHCLRQGGLGFEPGEIVASGHALTDVASARGWCGKQFFVMGVLGDPCYAEAAGLTTCRDPERLGDCHGVIVGEKRYDWEVVISAVFNFLIRSPDSPFVVPNPDMFFAVDGGRFHPASGATAAFVRTLCSAYGTKIEPLFLGKPFEPIFSHAHRHLEMLAQRQLDRDRVLIVGDSLSADIAGGERFGYRTALMLTGVTNRAGLGASALKPGILCDRIA